MKRKWKAKWKWLPIVLLVGILGYMGVCSISHGAGEDTVTITVVSSGTHGSVANARVTLFPGLPLIASPGTGASGPYVYQLGFCTPALVMAEVEGQGTIFRLTFLEPGESRVLSF